MDGFLPTRASIMLDVVFLAMFAVLPLLAGSIYLVRYRRNYRLHKRVQLTLGIVLLVAVTLFELDMQLVTDWEERARPSPYFDSWVKPILGIHLFFAIPTAVLWFVVIVRALRRFSNPPEPGPHSREHFFWAWLTTFETLLTALTGWVFYWLAFAA
jgi:putative membrane protein